MRNGTELFKRQEMTNFMASCLTVGGRPDQMFGFGFDGPTQVYITRGDQQRGLREEGKKLIGAYLEKPQRERLKAEAKRRGVTVADLVRDSINEYIGQHRSPGSNSNGR